MRVVRLMGLDLVGVKGKKKTAVIESTSQGEGTDIPVERVEDKTKDAMESGT